MSEMPPDPDTVSSYDFDAPATAGRGPLAWGVGLAVFALATLLFLDPLGWHGLDERLRGQAPAMDAAGDAAQLWTCPMHPEILQHEPGSCPICGMDLVEVDDGPEPMATSMHPHAGHDPAMTGEAGGDAWTCPMHEEIVESEPGSCPICGMDLVKVDDGPEPTATAGVWTCPMHEEIVESEPGSCPICGMDLVEAEALASEPMAVGPVVSLDPAVVQKMNVRTEPVARRDVRRDLRAVGYLEVDPKRRVTVTTKYRGWVEQVYVNYVGESVREGQPLFEIYAPELVQTQQELLSAVRYAESLAQAPADARRRAEELVSAARARLGYWDVDASQVERLTETGEVFRTLTVRSPASGVVTVRMEGLEGKAVQPGLELFEIADLGSLWLTVEVYEDQVAWIDVGSRVEVRLSYFPGERFDGRVRFLEPELRAETRTLGVRVEVPNPDRRLRSGMYAEARFRPPAVEDALAVPSQAVLRSGERDLVVVALGDGRFEPREVLLGHEGDGFVQVVQGLRPGERVVTSAQFLIDSESNLRAAIDKLRGSASAAGGHDHAG